MSFSDAGAVLASAPARTLVEAAPSARLAYTALDGSPRVVPVGFFWTGTEFVVGADPDSAKVRAMRANPEISLSFEAGADRDVLLVRGAAAITVVDGIPREYFLGARKVVDRAHWAAFEADVRSRYSVMARIAIVPEWAKVLDFQTKNPDTVAKHTRLRKLAQRSGKQSQRSGR